MAHKSKTTGIYKILAPSGNCYIGQSQNIEKRQYNHFHMMRKGNHPNKRLQGAFRRYGEDLTFSILEVCAREDLDAREQYWVDNSQCPYNMSRDAKYSLADPIVQAKARTTYKANGSGAKMAAKHKLLLDDPEWVAKKKATMITANACPTLRETHRQNTMAKWQDPVYRAKTTAGIVAAQRSPSTVAKHIANATATHADPEFKERHRAAITAAQARPEVKAKVVAFHLEYQNRPEVKATNTARLVAMHADPEFKERHRAILIAAQARPEVKAKASANTAKMWLDPEHRRKVKMSGALTSSRKLFARVLEHGLILLTAEGARATRMFGRRKTATEAEKRRGVVAQSLGKYLAKQENQI